MVEWFVSSSVLIALVLAVRAVLGKRLGAAARYALWLVVLVRLLIPVQLISLPFYSAVGESPAPSAPSSGVVVTLPEAPGEEQVTSPVTPITPTIPVQSEPMVERPVASEPTEPSRTTAEWLTIAWLVGAAAIAAAILASNLHFALALRRRRVQLKGADCALPVYTAKGLESPCLVGLFAPAIYLAPEDAQNEQRLRHILAHEQSHWRNGDHVWAVGRAAALCLHWFDPLVWVAAALSKRDAELACDARTLKALGEGERTAYGETLLSLVTAKPTPRELLSCSTAMSGGKKTLRERVEAIAQKPRTGRAAAFLAAAVAVLALVLAFGQEKSEYDAFLRELDRATEIGYMPDTQISVTDPMCTEEFTLSKVKNLLGKIEQTAEGDWPLTDGVEQNALFLGERQYGFQSDSSGTLLYRVEQNGEETQCFLVGRYSAETNVRSELEGYILRTAWIEELGLLVQFPEGWDEPVEFERVDENLYACCVSSIRNAMDGAGGELFRVLYWNDSVNGNSLLEVNAWSDMADKWLFSNSEGTYLLCYSEGMQCTDETRALYERLTAEIDDILFSTPYYEKDSNRPEPQKKSDAVTLFLQQVEYANTLTVSPSPYSSDYYPPLTGNKLQSAREELSAVEAADASDEPEGDKNLFTCPGVVVGEESYRLYPNSATGETLLYRQVSPGTAVKDSDYALVGKYSVLIINRLMTLAGEQRTQRFGFLPSSALRSALTATVSSGKSAWTVEDEQRDEVLDSLNAIGADNTLWREVTDEDTLVLYPSFDLGMTVELVGGAHISLWPLIEAGDGAVLLRYVSDAENRTFLLPQAGVIRNDIFLAAGFGDVTGEQREAIYDQVSVPYGDSDDLTVVARSLAGRIMAAWMEMPSYTAWKPVDVKLGDVSVTDIYFGEDENFLANVTLWLKFDGNYSANFWQAGAGLIAQDADGYWSWGGEMLVTLRDGAWYTDGIGGFGGSVNVGFRFEMASCEQLVKAFTLTFGFTHDYLIPSYFCDLPEDEIAKLGSVLDGYNGTQASDFLRAVSDHLAQYPNYHELTAEKLCDSVNDKNKDFTIILAAEPFQTVAAGNGRFALYDYGKREWALVLETGDVREIVTTFYRDLTDPNDSIAIFAMDDLLGFHGVAVQTDTAGGYHKSYSYYAWTDSGVQYVGYSFGFYDDPREATTAVDLDGDGRSELVTQLTYGADGVEQVIAFRWNGTSAEVGTPNWTKAGVDLDALHLGATQVQERYDSESGKLTLTYDADGETKTAVLWLTAESFDWSSLD